MTHQNPDRRVALSSPLAELNRSLEWIQNGALDQLPMDEVQAIQSIAKRREARSGKLVALLAREKWLILLLFGFFVVAARVEHSVSDLGWAVAALLLFIICDALIHRAARYARVWRAMRELTEAHIKKTAV